jgi:hypothetical protein
MSVEMVSIFPDTQFKLGGHHSFVIELPTVETSAVDNASIFSPFTQSLEISDPFLILQNRTTTEQEIYDRDLEIQETIIFALSDYRFLAEPTQEGCDISRSTIDQEDELDPEGLSKEARKEYVLKNILYGSIKKDTHLKILFSLVPEKEQERWELNYERLKTEANSLTDSYAMHLLNCKQKEQVDIQQIKPLEKISEIEEDWFEKSLKEKGLLPLVI